MDGNLRRSTGSLLLLLLICMSALSALLVVLCEYCLLLLQVRLDSNDFWARGDSMGGWGEWQALQHWLCAGLLVQRILCFLCENDASHLQLHVFTAVDWLAFITQIFSLKITFGEQYPTKAPRVRFTSEMFHPNIYTDGGERACCMPACLMNTAAVW
jgi:hypothetical protein